VKKETEFPGPEGFQDIMHSKENKKFHEELGKIFKQTGRQSATLSFGVINSKLAKLYPRKVRKWIEYAKTPRGFYDTAGEWTAGHLTDEDSSDNYSSFLKTEEEIVNKSMENLYVTPPASFNPSGSAPRNAGSDVIEDLDALDKLLSQLDLPAMDELDADFIEIQESEQPTSFLAPDKLLRALESVWSEEADGKSIPFEDDYKQPSALSKVRVFENEPEIFDLKPGPFPSFENITPETKKDMFAVADDPTLFRKSMEGKTPEVLQKYEPRPGIDSLPQLETKILTKIQFDDRYAWHLRRA